MTDYIKTIKLLVDVQENGIIILHETGRIIGRLTEDNDVNFEKLHKFDIKNFKSDITVDNVPDDVKENISKEYAEDCFEEFQQIERFEGKITLKDVADILQIGE